MKKNKTKKIILFLLLAGALIFVMHHTALAQYTNQEKIPGAEPTSDFAAYMKQIIGFGYAVIGILAMFMLCIGAYQYMMAAGNLAKVENAKETISSALLGLILGLMSFIILRTINPALVSLQAPNLGNLGSGGGILGGLGGAGTTSNLANLVTGNVDPHEQTRIAQYDPLVQKYAEQYNVDPNIVRAIIKQESNWNPESISPTGDYGIMNINYSSHPDFFQNNTWTDPSANINYGVKYFSGLLNNQANGDITTALAMYNGGPGNPNYGYANSVMLNYYNYQKAGYT